MKKVHHTPLSWVVVGCVLAASAATFTLHSCCENSSHANSNTSPKAKPGTSLEKDSSELKKPELKNNVDAPKFRFRVVSGKELWRATSQAKVPDCLTQQGRFSTKCVYNMLTGTNIIGPDGNAYLLETSHGLVKIGNATTVMTSAGELNGIVVAKHPSEDLGLIRLIVPPGVVLPVAELAPAGTRLKIGQEVTVISHNHPAMKGRVVVQKKRILGQAKYMSNKHFSNVTLTPKVWSGASGSGVYVGDMLVAVVWGSNSRSNTCTATDYRFVKELFNFVKM